MLPEPVKAPPECGCLFVGTNAREPAYVSGHAALNPDGTARRTVRHGRGGVSPE